MIIIGLTGGIGSGKSTVAELFKQLGVPVIDADQIARQVVIPGTATLEQIKHYFGEDVFTNNSLNRAALREKVLHNPEQRKLLEYLLHPLIRQEITKQVQALTDPYCIIEIPLLLESKPNPLIQRILVVDCPESLQIKRASTRGDFSEQQIKNIMAIQVSREFRLQAADDIVDNNTDLQHLSDQVKQLHQKYLELAEK